MLLKSERLQTSHPSTQGTQVICSCIKHPFKQKQKTNKHLQQPNVPLETSNALKLQPPKEIKNANLKAIKCLGTSLGCVGPQLNESQ